MHNIDTHLHKHPLMAAFKLRCNLKVKAPNYGVNKLVRVGKQV